MHLEFRRATRSDLPRLLEIERESFPTPWSPEAVAVELDPGDPRRLPVVAVEAERIVGFALVWVIADELHLVSFAVDPQRRREGIGQALLDAVLDTDEGRAATVMTLEVRSGNVPALALYRRNGFLDIALRPRYYPDTSEDAIVMLKPLRPAPTDDPAP